MIDAVMILGSSNEHGTRDVMGWERQDSMHPNLSFGTDWKKQLGQFVFSVVGHLAPKNESKRSYYYEVHDD